MNIMQTKTEQSGIQSILQVSKAAMLMEPMAEDLNDLLMVPPVRRVMIVAEALAKASAKNETLSAMVRENSVISHLREEGRRRGSGDIVVPRAFVSDFDRVPAREGGHV